MADGHHFENDKLQNALSMITNGDVITSSTENVLKLPKFHTLKEISIKECMVMSEFSLEAYN